MKQELSANSHASCKPDPGRVSRRFSDCVWLPVPVLICVMAALYIAGSTTLHHWPFLQVVLYVVCSLLAALLIAALNEERARSLNQTNQVLEHKVAERTLELARSVARLENEVRTRRIVEKDLRHSQETLLLAMESAGLGTFDYYPLTGNLIWSETTRLHYGVPADVPASYELFMSLLHQDDREWILRAVERVLRPENGGGFTAEFRMVGPVDGRERRIACNGQVFFNPAGEAVRFSGVTRDITIERHSEKMIQRLNRLHGVLTATNQAILHSSDSDDIFHAFSRLAVEQGGFRLATVGLLDRERGMVRIVAAAGATAYLEELRRPFSNLSRWHHSTSRCIAETGYCIRNDFCSDPVTRPWHELARRHGIRASASIALRCQGEVIGTLSLYADEVDFFDDHQVELLRQMGADVSFALDLIEHKTRRSQAEQALHQETAERLKALEALAEKERLLIQQSRQAAMGEMIGNIAHQWRQPLNSLGLTIQQLLLYYDLQLFDREFLAGSVENCMGLIQHMSRTIDDFRNYFKPDKEKVKFRVHEAVTNTISLMQGGLHDKRITMEVAAHADPVVYGYPNEFAQVLLNILINARDALTERHVPSPRVAVTVGQVGGRSVVTIADNAGGIPEEIIDRVFEPYFTTKGPQAGTGVGLFMSKTIIEKNMDGRLSVSNCEDGAEFRIEV